MLHAYQQNARQKKGPFGQAIQQYQPVQAPGMVGQQYQPGGPGAGGIGGQQQYGGSGLGGGYAGYQTPGLSGGYAGYQGGIHAPTDFSEVLVQGIINKRQRHVIDGTTGCFGNRLDPIQGDFTVGIASDRG